MFRKKALMHTAFLLPLLLLAATAECLTLKPGCQPSCGGVNIPYPFGIGQGCFRAGFEIQCNNGKPTLGNTSDNTQVTSLSVTPRPEARVMLRVAYQCYNSTGAAIDNYSGAVDLNPTGVYRISDTANELFVLGCNTMIFTNYTGCVAYTDNANSAQDGACAGIGCCHINIPPGLTDNLMRFTNDGMWPHSNQEFCPCDYGFIVEKGNYTFRAQDLHMDGSITSMPLRLDWAIRDGNSLSCAEAPIMQGYTCVSANSKCVDSINGPGYFCNCTEGYEGNPYLDNGCTSNTLSKRIFQAIDLYSVPKIVLYIVDPYLLLMQISMNVLVLDKNFLATANAVTQMGPMSANAVQATRLMVIQKKIFAIQNSHLQQGLP
jgi:hypothetical protein